MDRIALTGFTAFGDNGSNPTERMANHFSSLPFVNAKVIPVSYERSGREALAMDGSAIIMTGLAASRKEITLEKYAYNERRASIPDNDGVSYEGERIAEDGSDRIETTVDIEAILSLLKENGIPASISSDPGRYVCNSIYYAALYDGKRPSLFVHFPPFSAMDEDTEKKALSLILDYYSSTYLCE